MTTHVSALEALLVEDDDLDARILTVFAGMYEDCAIRFTRARTVGEALLLTRDVRFDMYFIDFNLGERSTLRLLTSLERDGARPVVISSISGQEADMFRLNTGALRFLAKSDICAASVHALADEALRDRRLFQQGLAS
jgi:DNA-binding NarL/FixJ family response regulator